MKKELKPKNGWRNSLIFSLRGKASEPGSMVSVQSSDSENLLAGLSAFERSWYYRAPLSSQFAEDVKQNKPREKQKVRTAKSIVSKVRSRLPAISVRRSTLIDIIKSKRVLGEILGSAADLPA